MSDSMAPRKQQQGLLRTQSGLLAPKSPGLGGVAGAMGGAAAGGLARGLSRTSSSGVLTPYNAQSGFAPAAGPPLAMGGVGTAAAGSGRARPPSAGGTRSSADGFRSEALQLEVRLAEGLQALDDAEEAEGGAPSAAQRLALCRGLFGHVIDKGPPFGRLLERIKAQYEDALKAAAQPTEPEVARLQDELARTKRELLNSRRRSQSAEEENALLRAELAKMSERESRLREEVRAYREHTYELQQAAQRQAEAEQAALAAELERELPPSARPGNVTHRLGGDNNLPNKVAMAVVHRPSFIPVLDMDAIVAKREADAHAEAMEAEAEAAAHDPDRPGEKPEFDEERLLELEAAAAAMAAGKEVPAHLQPALAAAQEQLRAMGWEEGESEDDEYGEANPYANQLMPRVLPPGTVPPSLLPQGQAGGGKVPGAAAVSATGPANGGTDAAAKATAAKDTAADAAKVSSGPGGGNGAIPSLDMSSLADPSRKPIGYQEEFNAEMAKHAGDAGVLKASAASAAVDMMLYGKETAARLAKQ